MTPPSVKTFRSFSMLYGLTWTAYALAGAIGPVLMGKVFDATTYIVDFLLRLSSDTAVLPPHSGEQSAPSPPGSLSAAAVISRQIARRSQSWHVIENPSSL